MESEQDENSQAEATYDDLELSDESNILAQEFLQSLASSSTNDQTTK